MRCPIGIVVFMLINRPQPGRRLKYFMRLVAIGFAYARRIVKDGLPILESEADYFVLCQMTSSLLRRSINASTLPAGSATKQNSAFDAFAEENF